MKKKATQIQRLNYISKKLLSDHEVTVESLARHFSVSHMTIHRDMDRLEKQAKIIRTHGGATSARKLTFEFSFQDKRNIQKKQKSCIAQKAATYVKDGQTVILDTGTTTLNIAKNLISKQNLTVITTSLAIVSQLQFSENIEVILLGG